MEWKAVSGLWVLLPKQPSRLECRSMKLSATEKSTFVFLGSVLKPSVINGMLNYPDSFTQCEYTITIII